MTYHPSMPESNQPPSQIGKYRIVGILGRGSMGVVYRGLDPEIGRTVAIKTLRRVHEKQEKGAPLGGTDAALERFRNEARSAGNLRHPNIITVFDASIDGDIPFIVMDYVEGESLSSVVARQGALPPAQAINYLSQISSAVDYAHKRRVFHRDIKPSNLIVDGNDTVFVLDFGVASISRSYSDWEMPLTKAPVVGTPGYMSPEQIMNEEIDHRSDLFSLAVVAYECFTGKRPFQGDDQQGLISATLRSKPQPVTVLCPHLPLALEAVLEQGLAKSRKDRMNSAQEFIEACAQALGLEISIGLPFGHSSRYLVRETGVVSGRIATMMSGSVPEMPPPPPLSEDPFMLGSSGGPGLWPTDSGGGRASASYTKRSAGEMFAHNTESVSGLAAESPLVIHTGSPRLRRLTVVASVASILVGAYLLLLALQSSNDKAVIDDSNKLIVVGVDEATTADYGALQEPATDPVPPGKEVRHLTDRQLLGLLKSREMPEGVLIAGIHEAEKRQIRQFVDVSPILLDHDSYVVRVESLKALPPFDDKRIVPQVILRLDDYDPVVRGFAARTLAKIGDRRVAGYLSARLVKEQDPQAKQALRAALQQITGVPVAD